MDQTNLQTYDLLANDGNLDLQNIQMCQHIFKSDWPTSYMQLDTTLKSYHNLIMLLLKPTHPYTAAYSIFLNIWKSIGMQLAELFATNPSMLAQFLRPIQLRMAVYWQSVNALNAIKVCVLLSPDFAELLNSVRIQSWIPPLLPGAPIGSAYIGTPTVAPNPAPALAPALAPAPATAPPATAPPATAPRTNVINPSPIPEVQATMTGHDFQLQTLLRNGVRAPTANNGDEICMSFHTVNRCFSDCSHRSIHHPLVGGESTVFCTFIQDNVVTPDIGMS